MNRLEIINTIKSDGLKLALISEENRNDKQIVRVALEQNPYALQFVGSKLNNDFEVVEYAFINKKEMVNYENPGGLSLIEYAYHSFRINEEILLNLLKYDLSLITYFPSHYLQEEYFMKKAVAKNGSVIRFANHNIKNNREIVLVAAKENGHFLLDNAFAQFYNDREIMLEGCVSNSNIIEDILPSEFKYDFEFVKELFSRTKCYVGSIKKNIPENIWRNKDFVLSSFILNSDLLLSVINDPLYFNDEVFILQIFDKMPQEHMFKKAFFKLLLKIWKCDKKYSSDKVQIIKEIIKKHPELKVYIDF